MIDDFLKKFGLAPYLLLGNPLRDWLLALLLGAAAWAILWLIRKFVATRYERFSAESRASVVRLLAYLLRNTTQLLFMAAALYVAFQVLNLPGRIERIGSNLVMIMLLLQVGFWARRSVRFYFRLKQHERGPDHAFAGSLDIVDFVASLLIWTLLMLLALSNLGVNITALVAGLGIGGVAVALALQNVLGDLFASLAIALDKPFVVGDSLTIDTFVGRVERIGIKTTRLRSDSGEQIILSNADILKSRVRNFGRVGEQRILMTIRASFSTPTDKLKALPKLLENIVREQTVVRFERSHLKVLGESAFIFELSYFVQEPAVNPPLDIQHAVNIRIIEELRRLGVDFAYPTQQIVLDRPPDTAA